MSVSDRWLRTFVEVAASGGFTAAARRLGVGQPAVSHAVARLEGELGVALFERSPRGLTLTAAGSLLQRRVTPALAEIDAAVDAARSLGSVDLVTLSVSTSLANFWLLPRLPEFKRHHPEIDLRVITTDSDDMVGRDDADLWIPLGLDHPSHLESTQFRVERIVPVASPGLASALGPSVSEDPAALLEAPLIHLEERYSSRYDWGRWFDHHGVRRRPPLGGDRSNDYSLVLQAALDGQGVALGWEHIVTRLIVDGRLVALSEPVETGQPFPILRRPPTGRAEHDERIDALRHWLCHED